MIQSFAERYFYLDCKRREKKLTYSKYHGSFILLQNTVYVRSGFKVKSQFLMKNEEWQLFDKHKQAWLLIISSLKAFDSLLSTLSHYYHI